MTARPSPVRRAGEGRKRGIKLERLNYQTLQALDYRGYLLRQAPERVLQFGEGGFLRAFADHFIDIMNEKCGFDGKILVSQPRGGHPEVTERFAAQDGLYTLVLRGRENGQKKSITRVISSISRCLDPQSDWEALLDAAANPALRFILSNTTEAGIVFDPSCRMQDAPPASYPAKLAAFLLRRYQLGLPGFWILPCELNDDNGGLLCRCLEQYFDFWQLGADFRHWFARENHICSTLVDRIVTGYPRGEAQELCRGFGYEDELMDAGEVFAFWVIEAPQTLQEELPFEKAGLPILITDDHRPYKQRKVRILNGAHTTMALGAYLAGKDIVRACMEDEVIHSFMNRAIYDEIIPTLDLPAQELTGFAAAVSERFNNPYIDHSLLAIALNSTAKWQARVLPSVHEYQRRAGKLPACLVMSFALYAAFYHNAKERGEGCLVGYRGADRYEVRDEAWCLDFFYDHRNDSAPELIHALVHNERMWGESLAQLEGFEDAAARALADIEEKGAYEAMRECLK